MTNTIYSRKPGIFTKVLLRKILVDPLGLLDFANKNTRCPFKFEFQITINNNLAKGHHRFNWAMCIFFWYGKVTLQFLFTIVFYLNPSQFLFL